MTKQDWIINLYNAAVDVANLLGNETVRYILKKYGADSIDNLSPIYYSAVFDELDFIASDLRD